MNAADLIQLVFLPLVALSFLIVKIYIAYCIVDYFSPHRAHLIFSVYLNNRHASSFQAEEEAWIYYRYMSRYHGYKAIRFQTLEI